MAFVLHEDEDLLEPAKHEPKAVFGVENSFKSPEALRHRRPASEALDAADQ